MRVFSGGHGHDEEPHSVSYRVKEIFATLQGEGILAGTPAVFVRFAGCNLWSGREEDRARDAARRADGPVACPEWCDTDFVGGEEMTADEIVRRVGEAMPTGTLVVLTGGEPLLQVDPDLIFALHQQFPLPIEHRGWRVAIETNGTRELPMHRQAWLWVTVSPKVPPAEIKLRYGAELKVVWPDYDPEAYEHLGTAKRFDHLVVQPRAPVGGSLLDPDLERAAAEWCLKHPSWRLSLQTHKHLGLP